MLKINTWCRDSCLFKNAEESRFKPNALVSIIVFFCIWGGSLLVGRIIVLPLIGLLPNSTILWASLSLSLRKILVCGIQIAAFFAWVKTVEKRKIATMGFVAKRKAKAYWCGVVIGFCSIALIVLAISICGSVEVDFNKQLPTDLLLGSLIISVSGWMVQSASEEIAIRGWLIPALGIRYNPLAAVLLTGGVFGIIHLFSSGATVLSFINLALSGFFFALYAIHAGNIWGVCGLHFGCNYALGSIFGLSISGEQSEGSSLLVSKTSDADLLTGGAFGPEGGLITTVFLVCAILFICILLHKKHKTRFKDQSDKNVTKLFT